MLPTSLKISVIVPLYNKEQYVEQTLRSILDQTIPCDEIIVINDGSTDDSENMVRKINHPLISIYSQENAGVSAARNKGIELARNPWIAFLDADDYWLPDYLERIYGLIQSYPECKAYATAFFLKNIVNGNLLESVPVKLHFKSQSGLMGNYFQAATYSHPPVHSSAIVVRKDLIQFLGGFPEGVTSGEDLITWARIALTTSIAYSTIPSTVFQYDPGRSFRIPQIPDYVGQEFRKLILKAPPHRRIWIKRYIGKWHKMRARSFIGSGFRWNALKEIRKSVYFDPLSRVWLFVPYMIWPKWIRIRIRRILERKP
jgi:glycosyltransferase involved in cell wall biosynthesis